MHRSGFVSGDVLRSGFQGRTVLLSGFEGVLGRSFLARAARYRPGRLLIAHPDERALVGLLQEKTSSPEPLVLPYRDPVALTYALRALRPDIVLHSVCGDHDDVLTEDPLELFERVVLTGRNLRCAAERCSCRVLGIMYSLGQQTTSTSVTAARSLLSHFARSGKAGAGPRRPHQLSISVGKGWTSALLEGEVTEHLPSGGESRLSRLAGLVLDELAQPETATAHYHVDLADLHNACGSLVALGTLPLEDTEEAQDVCALVEHLAGLVRQGDGKALIAQLEQFVTAGSSAASSARAEGLHDHSAHFRRNEPGLLEASLVAPKARFSLA